MLSRRNFLCLGAAAAAGLARGDAPDGPGDVHRQILDMAARQETRRRARFAAISTPAELLALQKELRDRFLKLLDDLPPTKGLPPAQTTGQLDGVDSRM